MSDTMLKRIKSCLENEGWGNEAEFVEEIEGVLDEAKKALEKLRPDKVVNSAIESIIKIEVREYHND